MSTFFRTTHNLYFDYENLFLFLFFLKSNIGLSQTGDSINFPIDSYAFKVEKDNKLISSSKLKYDSISSVFSKFSNLFITENRFKKSKTYLTIKYFIKEKELVLIKVLEHSPVFSDLYFERDYYIKNDTVFYTRMFGKTRSCLAIMPGENTFGYNLNLQEEFIKDFSINQWKKLKRS